MWIPLDTNKPRPLNRQIYEQFKQHILCGFMQSGQKLPSTRSLSRQLGVSRNTVLEAYEQLLAEGYLHTRHGSGTVVAPSIPLIHGQGQASLPGPAKPQGPVLLPVADQPHTISFRSGIPALDVFPRKQWARAYQQSCMTLPASALRYAQPAGVWELREALAHYLMRSRGIQCLPERVMITSGATQGLWLLSRLLFRQGAVVLTEDPAHAGLLQIVHRAGYAVQGLAVDSEGMDTSLLEASGDTAFVYTSPSHQYPLGGILSVQRRLELIRFARQTGCYVVEDDYDSEFRYQGHPASSLYELDPEKVIYLGSFSKTLAPALRLGFALLPKELLKAWTPEKMYADVHTDALSQHALAMFINNGGFEKHVWTMKKLYKSKRAHLIQQLRLHCGDTFTIQGEAAGLHLVAAFKNIRFEGPLLQRLREHGLEIIPVERYALQAQGAHSHQIILGYAHLSLEAITEGVRILAAVLALP